MFSIFQHIRSYLPTRRRTAAPTAEKRGMTWNLFNTFSNFFKVEATISKDKSLGISGVWRAITLLGESVASLPLDFYREAENGDCHKAKKHPLYKLLRYSPSSLYTSFSFREALVVNLALHGNAYAVILRDEDSRPIELILVEPTEVTPFYDSAKRRIYYRVLGFEKPIMSWDMIHITGMSTNGIMGINKLSYHGKTLNGASDLRDFAINFFANGAAPSGVLEYEKELSQDGYNRLKASWQAQYGGVENAGKTPLLEFGVKYKKIGATPAEAGLIENQKHYLEEISRIFGVPLHLLANLERATFNNIEHLSLQFVKHTIMPLCKRIEEELERKLLMDMELGEYRIKFNMEGLLRGDTKNRAEYYRTMFSIGAMTINEIRQKENLNRVDGGDINYRPLNMEDITKPVEDEQSKKKQEGESQTDDIKKPQAQ